MAKENKKELRCYETVCLKNEQAVLKRFHYKSSYGDNINRLTLRVFNIFSLLAIVTMFSNFTRKRTEKEAKESKRERRICTRTDGVFHSKRTAEAKPYAAVGAWFLGPKAENANIFTDLATKAFNAHLHFRKR